MQADSCPCIHERQRASVISSCILAPSVLGVLVHSIFECSALACSVCVCSSLVHSIFDCSILACSVHVCSTLVHFMLCVHICSMHMPVYCMRCWHLAHSPPATENFSKVTVATSDVVSTLFLSNFTLFQIVWAANKKSTAGHALQSTHVRQQTHYHSLYMVQYVAAGLSRTVGQLGGPGQLHAVLGLATHKVQSSCHIIMHCAHSRSKFSCESRLVT